jgi:hypothetical protein
MKVLLKYICRVSYWIQRTLRKEQKKLPYTSLSLCRWRNALGVLVTFHLPPLLPPKFPFHNKISLTTSIYGPVLINRSHVVNDSGLRVAWRVVRGQRGAVGFEHRHIKWTRWFASFTITLRPNLNKETCRLYNFTCSVGLHTGLLFVIGLYQVAGHFSLLYVIHILLKTHMQVIWCNTWSIK